MNTKQVVCRAVPRPLQLSGNLDDLLWQQAQCIDLVDTQSGKPGRFATTARLLYSRETLYVGFHCVDTYVWGTHTQRDDSIFTEECVEVFISPAGTAHQYFEINLSPKNVVFDACILNPRTIEQPKLPITPLCDYHIADLQTCVSVDGKLDAPGEARSWSAEYAIPFSAFVGAPNSSPQPGDTWRLNLYRIDALAPRQQEFYAWCPTGIIDFHRPWCFGTLLFA